jgi:hypothetical protein
MTEANLQLYENNTFSETEVLQKGWLPIYSIYVSLR